jgi:YidC/Oxa1 family membrane protein insertase
VLSQLTSSWYMSTTMQGAQRWMLMVLPIAFVPFLLHFPAGLMIYWLTTNLWTTGQGVITRRLIPKPEPAPKRSSRAAAQDEPPPDTGNGARPKRAAPAKPGSPAVAGPPRRVRRKKGGGGRRR